MDIVCHMASTPTLSVLRRLARQHGLVRASDAARAGVHPQILGRLVRSGVLQRLGRGRYRLAGSPLGPHADAAAVASRVPRGVLCLLTALRLHGLGTHLPGEVWVLVPRNAGRPRSAWPELRVWRASGAGLRVGIEEIVVDGVKTRVTGASRTVVDCFRRRSVVGVEVAIEALRAGLEGRRFTVGQVAEHARALRCWTVVRPYLEAMS